MDRQDLFDYVKQEYGTDPDYPWNDWNAVLRHKENQKWYGLVMEISRDKLGFSDSHMIDVLNVKCDPLMVGSLRTQPGFHPAYHMNKDKWITVRLDGSVEDEKIKNLIHLSYALTSPKQKSRKKCTALQSAQDGTK